MTGSPGVGVGRGYGHSVISYQRRGLWPVGNF